MQINGITRQNTNNRPSFGTTAIIQIPKSAFGPVGLDVVEKTFSKVVNDIAAEKSGKFNNFLNKLGLLDDKIRTYLEQPLFVELWKTLKPDDGDLSWLSKNIGVKIDPPASSDHYTFHLFSAEDKEVIELLGKRAKQSDVECYTKMCERKKIMSPEIKDEYCNRKILAIKNIFLSNEFNFWMRKRRAPEYTANDALELRNIIEKFDL